MADEKVEIEILLRDRVSESARSIDRHLGGIAATAGKVARAGGTMGKSLADGFEKATRAATKFGKTADKAFDVSKKAGMSAAGIAAAGAAAAYAMASPAQKAAALEKALSRVGAATDFSAEEMAQMKRVASELGATTEFTAVQVANLEETLGRKGFNADQIEGMSTGVLNLAAASDVAAASSADLIGTILKTQGLSARASDGVASALVAQAAQSNVSFETLSGALVKALPITRQYGVELSELLASTGALGDAGIESEVAGTGFKIFAQHLSGSVDTSAKMLKKLGVQVTDSNGEFLPFMDRVTQLAEVLADYSEAERAALMTKMFGTEAAAVAATIVDSHNEIAVASQRRVRDMEQADAASIAAARLTDNLQGSVTRLDSAYDGLSTKLGDLFIPTVRMAVDATQSLVTKASDWIAQNPGIIKSLAVQAAGIGTVAAGIAALNLGISAMGIAWGVAAKGAKLAGIAMRFALRPVTLTILGVVAAASSLAYAVEFLISLVASGGDWDKAVARTNSNFANFGEFLAGQAGRLGGAVAEIAGSLAGDAADAVGETLSEIGNRTLEAAGIDTRALQSPTADFQTLEGANYSLEGTGALLRPDMGRPDVALSDGHWGEAPVSPYRPGMGPMPLSAAAVQLAPESTAGDRMREAAGSTRGDDGGPSAAARRVESPATSAEMVRRNIDERRTEHTDKVQLEVQIKAPQGMSASTKVRQPAGKGLSVNLAGMMHAQAAGA